MQLAIFNGSPRGKNSNTQLLLKHFINGFTGNGGEVISSDFLISEKQLNQHVLNFKKADNILISFPLYVDSVPGNVKKFIETIGNYDGSGKRILFLVQSGFPEAIHSEGVKKYLQLLTKRWKMQCTGIIVKPGVEGIRIMPDVMTRGLFQKMTDFGVQLVKNKKVDPFDIEKLAKPYKFSKSRILFFRILKFTGMSNFYWNKKLKEHNAFDKRFNAPLL